VHDGLLLVSVLQLWQRTASGCEARDDSLHVPSLDPASIDEAQPGCEGRSDGKHSDGRGC
jgi:hypothetical protein